MKQTLSIFVSGAKRLKEHRMRLKVLANDLNNELRSKGENVVINMYSYMNLGDDQKEYDDFIENKSDIVLFILEDSIGDKTRNEFLKASAALKKTGTPRIFVFLREFSERTPEIEEIDNLVSRNSDYYYVEYTSVEDLAFKVKERLVQEVERMRETRATPKRQLRALKWWACMATAVMIVLAAVLWNRSQGVTLLFVGGGSAVNCLERIESIGNIYSYENSICISVPTNTSWPIVTSEVIHQHAIKGARNNKLFYPISLSAMEAVDADFLNMSNHEQFVAKGSVLAFFLGDDCLTTYVKKSYRDSLIDGRDSIRIDELAVFLRKAATQEVMIFTTQEGSGTLTYYQKSLAPYDMKISKETLGTHVDKFTDLTPRSKIKRDETPYIMLGSTYYVAQEVVDDGDCRPICILDENGKAIKKSIYLYFAGYNVDDGASYWIPDEMVDFLIKLDARFKGIIKDNKIPRENERVIVLLNDYLK